MKVNILSFKETDRAQIKISCDDTSAKIYYTLDGSTPNNNSTLYSDAIDYPRNTTIKAIAINDTEQSEIAEYKCSIPIINSNIEHITIINAVDFLGKPIGCRNITFGTKGKIYNAVLMYKTMIYPLGLNLKNHVVPGKKGTDLSDWKAFGEGQVIYDPDLKKMKLFNGEAWVNLDGTQLAASTSNE